MPDRMPDKMSDRMPEDLPVTKCINFMVGITRSKVSSMFFDIFHLSDFLGLFEVSVIFSKCFFWFFWGVLVVFLFFWFFWTFMFFFVSVFFWFVFEWLDLFVWYMVLIFWDFFELLDCCFVWAFFVWEQTESVTHWLSQSAVSQPPLTIRPPTGGEGWLHCGVLPCPYIYNLMCMVFSNMQRACLFQALALQMIAHWSALLTTQHTV